MLGGRHSPHVQINSDMCGFCMEYHPTQLSLATAHLSGLVLVFSKETATHVTSIGFTDNQARGWHFHSGSILVFKFLELLDSSRASSVTIQFQFSETSPLSLELC